MVSKMESHENRAPDAPRRPQDAPRRPQDTAKTPPRRPKTAPETAQDAPKTLQRHPKTLPEATEFGLHVGFPLGVVLMANLGPFWVDFGSLRRHFFEDFLKDYWIYF